MHYVFKSTSIKSAEKIPFVTAFTKISKCVKKGLEDLLPDSVYKQKDESGNKHFSD